MAAAAMLDFGKCHVNNSELDRTICTKFGGQIHHGHAEMTHDQKSNRKIIRVASLNECREHRCDDLKAYKSSQLTDLYFKFMQNSPVCAIV